MKTNKLIYAMFCICMFFCGCMTTTPSITSSQPTMPSVTQLTTQSTISSLPQPTTQSFINVQRKDNSEPLKIGTIVHYAGNAQTIFSVKQVLNNKSFGLDNDDTNTYYDVSQMVLVHAYTYDNFLERFCLDNDNYMSAWIIPSEGHFYSSEQSIVKGYYKYLGNCTYETVGKNPDGSPIYNTLRVFCEVDEPIDDTK